MNGCTAGENGDGGSATADFRFTAHGKILVCATCKPAPKCLDEQPSYALFQGVFNPDTGGWTRSEAQKVIRREGMAAEPSDDILDGAA